MTEIVSEAENKKIITQADAAIRQLVDAFLKGERKLYRSKLFTNMLTAFFSWMFTSMGRRFLGKTYITDSRCNQCGICVKACPVNCIKITGLIQKKPFWRFNCEDCARCMNICPQQAIQASIARLMIHGILNIGFFIVSFWLAGPLAQRYIPGIYPPLGWLIVFALINLLAIWIQFLLLDRFLFFLEQLPIFRKLFSRNTTQSYGRYLAPGFKPDLSK